MKTEYRNNGSNEAQPSSSAVMRYDLTPIDWAEQVAQPTVIAIFARQGFLFKEVMFGELRIE